MPNMTNFTSIRTNLGTDYWLCRPAPSQQ